MKERKNVETDLEECAGNNRLDQANPVDPEVRLEAEENEPEDQLQHRGDVRMTLSLILRGACGPILCLGCCQIVQNSKMVPVIGVLELNLCPCLIEMQKVHGDREPILPYPNRQHDHHQCQP